MQMNGIKSSPVIGLGLMFFCAFALSGAAAFYSIVGLMAIFAAAPTPIAIMGSILEVSKLVVASWLYRNWRPIPKLMKGYLTGALVVLMLLTSMGIFGFLSKAHLDQAVPSGDIAAQVQLIDEKIKTEKDTINEARQTISQLDSQVNQYLSRSTDESGVSNSVIIRRQQAKERASLTKQIESSQAAIAKLREERSPIASQLRKVEAEVGPIKYIAALIYGDEATSDQTILEKAVRWVIILIVTVFDPLAVVMLIAANWSLLHRDVNEEFVELEAKNEDPDVDSPNQLSVVEDQQTTQEEAPTIQNDDVEHPVFRPESNYWGSRPGNHLEPHDPRRNK